MRLYYAQNKEDLLIGGFFPDVEKGFYIDVGANDPTIDSVTKLFYERGWRGVNVDPIKRHYEALEVDRPEDTNLHIGLGDKPGTLTFTEYPEGDGLSTFDTSMQDYYKNGNHTFPTDKVKQYETPVKTLQQVVESIRPKHIHFVKIDVEGYEYEVIKGYDWAKVRPELVCIEANHINKDWRPLLEAKKYHEVFFDGVNNYYLAEESLHRKDLFSYPDAAFAANPVYYQAFLEAENRAEKRIEEKAQELGRVITDKEQTIAGLHSQQRDVRFLAKRLVVELQVRLNRRAKGVKSDSHLRYRTDQKVRAMLEKGHDTPKKELLAFIKDRDKVNIFRQKTTANQKAKRLYWKLMAKSFTTLLIVSRKITARVTR